MNTYIVIVIISKKLRTKNLPCTSYRLKMLKCQIDYKILKAIKYLRYTAFYVLFKKKKRVNFFKRCV